MDTITKRMQIHKKCPYHKLLWGNDKTAYSDYYFENLFRN